MNNNKEHFFINILKNKHIGDDGCVLGKWVYSKDVFVEDVHFKKQWLSYKQIIKKAIKINISDAIVMNAKAKYALLAISLPKHTKATKLQKIAKLIKKYFKKYNIKLIGGDSISDNKIYISITLISKLQGKATLRSGAKNKDLFAYTNNLGSVSNDLDKLLKGDSISKNSKFINPKLNGEFFYKIAPYVNSAIDISDGLYNELCEICTQSDVDIEFIQKQSKINKIAYSGEEYEILFSFNNKFKKTILDIAKRYNVKINIFAKAIKLNKKSKYENKDKLSNIEKLKNKQKAHHF
jgi:thiamine-monophosphate kinase